MAVIVSFSKIRLGQYPLFRMAHDITSPMLISNHCVFLAKRMMISYADSRLLSQPEFGERSLKIEKKIVIESGIFPCSNI